MHGVFLNVYVVFKGFSEHAMANEKGKYHEV